MASNFDDLRQSLPGTEIYVPGELGYEESLKKESKGMKALSVENKLQDKVLPDEPMPPRLFAYNENPIGIRYSNSDLRHRTKKCPFALMAGQTTDTDTVPKTETASW
ncbi:uncharacterized protein N7503_007337 [Penicillium pulvis]|uniref:uncharacterized protein n=1 Tax=Penicillium pulvis TaxID=1562058 RepID=UPI0025497266|nr:uncharacterized protein N7503_007337 [Penicillium pulvis]KAJ5798041.1 hypothetical protein N7503_007337 [Penicillium pulvis]